MVTKYQLQLLGQSRLPVLVTEKEYEYRGEIYDNPREIANMIKKTVSIQKMAEEYLYILAMDSKMHLLGLFEVSHGTVQATSANPREIFIRCLLVGATSVVVVHNHPSGSLAESKDDRVCSKRISDAGKLLGVDMLDFLIVSNNGYASFKEKNLL